MTIMKDGGAQTEVGPHNTVGVAMEDLPKAEKIALEKELEEEMVAARRRKLACFQKTCTKGDQEDRHSHHDYYDYSTHGNI
jgi:hypothetical protein